MKRAALYSRPAPRDAQAPPAAARADAGPARTAASTSASVNAEATRSPPTADVRPGPRSRWSAAASWRRHPGRAGFAGGLMVALAALVAAVWVQRLQPPPRELTQKDIDAAVMHTVQTQVLPAQTARAAEAVRRSVVKVRGFHEVANDAKTAPTAPGRGEDQKDPKDQKPRKEQKPGADKGAPGGGEQARQKPAPIDPARPDEHGNVGSGVVIVDTGIILTNLHVVAGAKRLVVTFFDGQESEADIVGVQPQNDLAVVRARTVPDDLPAATLGSTQGLQPGDAVVAVGFPFDIGPSVSAGVVSGLNREFRSPEGERQLSGLIQFDAAANPGNSGGPLVTMAGDVVGIVTAILNPTEARTFIGIGFAATIESAGQAVGMPPF
ncbi:MAG: trypsin-like peptidase domain-containing protein [Burkholderiaceae bacterium]